MNRLLTAALALSLIGGAAANAQPHDDHRPDGPGRAEPHGSAPAPQVGHGNAAPFDRRGPPQGRAQGPGPQSFRGPPQGPFAPAGRGPHPGGQDHQPYQGPQPGFNRGPQAYGGPAPRAFPRGPGGQREWNAGQRFRGPAYAFPRGFGYRVWSFGEFLPAPFFADNYTLYDYWDYGLPQPPPGFEWVRVGGDALLVRPVDGYILDVAHDLFW
jgi:Ni/Co efflux regulator RcnB